MVLDATALERNLNLALQVLEMSDHVVLCVNLIDRGRDGKGNPDQQRETSRQAGGAGNKTAGERGKGWKN